MRVLPCCYDIGPVLAWGYLADGWAHLGVFCPGCGRWIRWVPQTDEWLSMAPPFLPAWAAK